MDTNQITGKELHNLKISELLDEYKKTNNEGSKLINAAIELNILEMKRNEIELKLKEYSDYTSEIAKEFIKRFL